MIIYDDVFTKLVYHFIIESIMSVFDEVFKLQEIFLAQEIS